MQVGYRGEFEGPRGGWITAHDRGLFLDALNRIEPRVLAGLLTSCMPLLDPAGFGADEFRVATRQHGALLAKIDDWRSEWNLDAPWVTDVALATLDWNRDLQTHLPISRPQWHQGSFHVVHWPRRRTFEYGCNLGIERRAEAEARIMDEFRSRLRMDLDAMEAEIQAAGGRRTFDLRRREGPVERAYDWVVRYQVKREDYGEIAAEYHADDPNGDRDITDDGIRKAVERTARRLNLTLR